MDGLKRKSYEPVLGAIYTYGLDMGKRCYKNNNYKNYIVGKQKGWGEEENLYKSAFGGERGRAMYTSKKLEEWEEWEMQQVLL